MSSRFRWFTNSAIPQIPLKANRIKILKALQWLKLNNVYYEDLEIDFEALLHYPANSDDFVEGLSTITVETGEDESPPAEVYTEQEGETGVTYSAIPTQVPGATVREEISRQVLGEAAVTVGAGGVNQGEELQAPQVEWPDRSGPPVTENSPGFYSQAFPWLPGFCHGRADITVPGRPAGNPQYLAWLKHLTHHPSRAFTQDTRFLLFCVNRYQRNKAMTMGNIFIKYSCKDITIESLKEQVAGGDMSVFKKLLYFSRSTIGQFHGDSKTLDVTMNCAWHII